jgi:hypothetical protein
VYNANMPAKDDLPSSGQLIKSTIIAIVSAILILAAIVLPAEYAIDPTGIGRMLNLTEMGEIKQQLATEAKADRLRDQQQGGAPPTGAPERRSGLFERYIATLFLSSASAAEPVVIAQVATRTDETVFTLKPNEGVEYKMVLPHGGQVDYSWRAEGGVVNYDMHGSPSSGGKESSYKTSRGVTADDGKLTAGFDGSHGWFWRNRGKGDVTITLRTKGAYPAIRRMM